MAAQTNLWRDQYNKARLNKRQRCLTWAKAWVVAKMAEIIAETMEEDHTVMQRENLTEKVD